MVILKLAENLRDNIARLLNCKNEENIVIKVYENSSNVYFTLEEFLHQYNPEGIGKGQCNLIFRIDIDKTILCTFQLKDMYNCAAILVGSDLFVNADFRNLGIGKLMTKLMIDFGSYYGYAVLQGADLIDNKYMVRIFEELGWKKTHETINKKTNNRLAIWLLNLN